MTLRVDCPACRGERTGRQDYRESVVRRLVEAVTNNCECNMGCDRSFVDNNLIAYRDLGA